MKYRVKLHCNKCGETYILRGKKLKEGKIETGFKQCLCNNEDDFDIKMEQHEL